MEKNKNFKLTVNISKVGYQNKQDATAAVMNNRQYLKKNNLETMRFKESSLTVEEFINLVSTSFLFAFSSISASL